MDNIGIDIRFSDRQFCYAAGDTVSGIADVILTNETPLSALSLTFAGTSEIRWIEDVGEQCHTSSLVYFSKDDFLKQLIPFAENDVTIIDEEDICPDLAKRRLAIAFSFQIRTDQCLPSSMVSSFGFIKYQVRLTIKSNNENEEAKNYVREIFLETPLEHNRLMIAADGTLEKIVLLHVGHASMFASVDHKSFCPYEAASVFVKVDNHDNAHIIPRVNLQQVQITACDTYIWEKVDLIKQLLIEPLTWDEYQKSVKVALSKKFVIGAEVATTLTKVKDLIGVILPIGELLSIKNDLITVKYFLCLALDIPHSSDLGINLPIVLTPTKVLAAIQAEFVKCLDRVQA